MPPDNKITVDTKQGDAISRAALQLEALRVQTTRTGSERRREHVSDPCITFTTRMFFQPLWTHLFSIMESDCAW